MTPPANSAPATIRERDAIDVEERNRGTVCLGAPIRDFTGAVIAALSASGKIDRVTPEYQEHILPHLLDLTLPASGLVCPSTNGLRERFR